MSIICCVLLLIINFYSYQNDSCLIATEIMLIGKKCQFKLLTLKGVSSVIAFFFLCLFTKHCIVLVSEIVPYKDISQ
jgi:hypothetical protein